MLTASMFLCFAKYANVTSGEPSLIIRWTVIKLLKTTVHVESLKRCCRALKTSPTPASPAWVAMRMCSMYLVFGGAACRQVGVEGQRCCRPLVKIAGAVGMGWKEASTVRNRNKP